MPTNMAFNTMLLCVMAFVGLAGTEGSQIGDMSTMKQTITVTQVNQESTFSSQAVLQPSQDQSPAGSLPHSQGLTQMPSFHSTGSIQPSIPAGTKYSAGRLDLQTLQAKTPELDSSKTLQKDSSEIQPVLETPTVASTQMLPTAVDVSEPSSGKVPGISKISCEESSKCQTAVSPSTETISNTLGILPTSTAAVGQTSTQVSMPQPTFTESVSSLSLSTALKPLQASCVGSLKCESTTSVISPTTTTTSTSPSAPVTTDDGLSVFDIVKPVTKPSGTATVRAGKKEHDGMSPGAKTAIGILVTLLIAGLVIGGVVLHRRYNFTHRSLKSFLTSGVRYKTYNNATYKDDEVVGDVGIMNGLT